MRLTKNPEVLKLIIVLSSLFLIFLIVAIIGTSSIIRSHTTSLLDYQAAIIGAVIDTYPDAESSIIQQLEASDEESTQRGRELLARYGYDDPRYALESERLQAVIRSQTVWTVTLLIVVSLVLATVFFLFVIRRYQSIRELHDYTRDVADGRGSLDIRDNAEGQFSMLKNEIYTITTMLKEQSVKLKREKSSLSDSIADISHQLKTPLTSLSVMTDLLMDEPGPEIRQQFLQRIRAQLDRMTWLVSSLLTLSKLDAGTLELKQIQYPASLVIRRALDTLQIPVEIKQHRIALCGDDTMLLTGDPEWTAEALINLLKNAIEHTPERGEIRITCEANPIYHRIILSDSGTGIDKRDLPYVFHRFYKGHNAGDDSVGIGLAMAHAIVKRQNGDITVASELGVGTTFTVTFYKS